MLLADRGFGRASLLRRLQEMPRHTGRTVDYAVRLKGNVHIQTADGYQGLLRKYPLRPNHYVFLPGSQYRSDGAVVVNLILYWGRGHQYPWYLATLLSDAKVAVRHYRQRMQPEQCFRDGKQYFALDQGSGKDDGAAGAYAGGAIVSLLFAVVGGAVGVVAVPAAGVFVGEAGAAAAGDGMLSGYAGAPAQVVRLAHHMKVGTPERRPRRCVNFRRRKEAADAGLTRCGRRNR